MIIIGSYATAYRDNTDLPREHDIVGTLQERTKLRDRMAQDYLKVSDGVRKPNRWSIWTIRQEPKKVGPFIDWQIITAELRDKTAALCDIEVEILGVMMHVASEAVEVIIKEAAVEAGTAPEGKYDSSIAQFRSTMALDAEPDEHKELRDLWVQAIAGA